MPPSRQVALANNYGNASAISPKVPMFLQKLYKIVSDPSTNDVICWSDNGDSFFVHDHERLAKEHLGNWFKHNKFASFVRQLNMYGFHKIPHLQQGVLRSDSDAEHSQFAHPDFHRGQEDRLIFIERKKQPGGNKADQGTVDFPVGAPANNSTQNAAGQQLDWHSIVNGIAAIRRHQNSISQELSELKRSNQLLWQESMEARQRHQRQQDTINRIIKFLAGVFGQHVSASPRGEKDAGSPSHSVVPGPRLMIEDRKRGSGNGKVEITEVQDEENMSPIESRSREVSPRPFTVETPTTTVGGSEAGTPILRDLSSFPSSIEIRSPRVEAPPSPTGSTSSRKSSNANSSIISTQPRYPAADITQESINGTSNSRAPSHSPSFDVKFQNALSQLSSSELQQLFASLATQSGVPDTGIDLSGFQPDNSQVTPPASTSQLAPYNKNFDFSSFAPPSNSVKPPEGLISFDNNPYLDQNWRAAEDIEKDVNSVHSNIDSLIETLGLDPSLLGGVDNGGDAPGLDPSMMLDPSNLPPTGDPAQPPGSDDFFNTYLYNMNDGPATDTSTTSNNTFDFSVPAATIPPSPADSSSNADSPETNPVLPPPAAVAKGRKRKSQSGPTDVAMKLYLPPNPRGKKQKK
ncbi:Heat shock transcription factor [Paramarasmius palmivorus]|uniref:Heat shock transcription factor n=1 Tax=Paramarasmius palmivorus TaxID=297713 RepID=A0AAW0EAU8_9AGAR